MTTKQSEMGKLSLISLYMEQVGTSALKHLTHAKSNKVFYYLEFGVRDDPSCSDDHHHIINRDNDEVIRNIYQKLEESPCKSDWALLIKKDFEFIGEQINQSFILNTPKEEYSK